MKNYQCPHKEMPISFLTSWDWTISTIRWFNRINPTDWVITLSVQDQPHEVDEIKFEILLRSALRNVNKYLPNTEIKRIKDWVKADITLHFALPGDPRLPAKFKTESLAYGIPPYDWEHAGKIFVNEKRDRSQMWENDKWLRIALEHEILHTLNIWHSNIESDIMYYRYNTANQQEYTKGTRQLLAWMY